MHHPLSVIPALVFVLALSGSVMAAAPHIIIISGNCLPKPVVIAHWDKNHQFLAAIAQQEFLKTEELVDRPFLELSLFWGPEWLKYTQSGQSPQALRPEQGNQHGRLYLATDSANPAVQLNNVFAQKLTTDGINLLVQNGVPARCLEHRRSPLGMFSRVWVLGPLLFLMLAAVFLLYKQGQRFRLFQKKN